MRRRDPLELAELVCVLGMTLAALAGALDGLALPLAAAVLWAASR